MIGPFPVVGNCIADRERKAMAYLDISMVHPGDLVLWKMPLRAASEQFAAKWLVADSAGDLWIACKFFATRFVPGFHVPVARVVHIVSGEEGSLDPALSESMSREIQDLRAWPSRPDLVVFASDLLAYEDIVRAIDEHRRHQEH